MDLLLFNNAHATVTENNAQTDTTLAMTDQTVACALEQGIKHLRNRVDDAAIDANVLLCYAIQKSPVWLIAHSDDVLTEEQSGCYHECIRKRRSGVPVAYITGRREFWSLMLEVSSDTLIPRPETEHLVEVTLQLGADKKQKILDFGTGSGAIAIAIAHERPKWSVCAIDQSIPALNIARRNAKRHGTDIDFIHGNSLQACRSIFDIITSNPPYVAIGDPHLARGDVRFEPQAALLSGHDGLECARYLIQNTPAYLHDGGWLIMEHGYHQANTIKHLLTKRGFSEIHSTRDLSGLDRIIAARYRRHHQ